MTDSLLLIGARLQTFVHVGNALLENRIEQDLKKPITTITLTADRAALCVRSPYAQREKMMSISPHLRRGVRDGTGFWWRMPLHAYGIVAFVLPDVSVDYDVFVALDGVNTAKELLRYKASLQKMPTSKQDKSQVLAIAPMLTDDPEKMIAFSEFAKKNASKWKKNERKR